MSLRLLFSIPKPSTALTLVDEVRTLPKIVRRDSRFHDALRSTSEIKPDIHLQEFESDTMADTDQAIAEVYRKIEREKALINAASQMRMSTNNTTVQARVDSNIRDGRRNISYLEDKLQELQLRKMGPDGGPPPPMHGGPNQQGRGRFGDAPTPPPKDSRGYFTGQNDRGDYGDVGPGGYSQGGTGMMPPRAPYGDPRQQHAPMPKSRPNFSKLGKVVSFSQVQS